MPTVLLPIEAVAAAFKTLNYHGNKTVHIGRRPEKPSGEFICISDGLSMNLNDIPTILHKYDVQFAYYYNTEYAARVAAQVAFAGFSDMADESFSAAPWELTDWKARTIMPQGLPVALGETLSCQSAPDGVLYCVRLNVNLGLFSRR
jgi:hypothetical protein